MLNLRHIDKASDEDKRDELDVSADEAIKLRCEARERYERDWTSSYKSGEREGEKKGITFVIKSALANGKTPEEIAAFTGLPLTEVDKCII